MSSLNKCMLQGSLLRLAKEISLDSGARGACDLRNFGPNLLRFAEVINTQQVWQSQ